MPIVLFEAAAKTRGNRKLSWLEDERGGKIEKDTEENRAIKNIAVWYEIANNKSASRRSVRSEAIKIAHFHNKADAGFVTFATGANAPRGKLAIFRRKRSRKKVAERRSNK